MWIERSKENIAGKEDALLFLEVRLNRFKKIILNTIRFQLDVC